MTSAGPFCVLYSVTRKAFGWIDKPHTKTIIGRKDRSIYRECNGIAGSCSEVLENTSANRGTAVNSKILVFRVIN